MKKIIIKSLVLQNFKGCKERKVKFADKTYIYGANATGKTTLFDGFMWLLFDKDSTWASKFQIRPLDADGKQIDNVEIKVEATLVVDGKEKVLTKVQKQNWVKKRGFSESTLQGNVNSYEVDGYPKSEKDFKECVADIVSEDLFKMITSPTYFTALKLKEQREILMKFVTDVTDLELALGNPQFAELVDEIEKAPSTDDIQKKYQKALTEWKKKAAEIPVRIDEAIIDKKIRGVDIDLAELELGKKSILEQLQENLDKQITEDGLMEGFKNISNEISELQIKQQQLKANANKDAHTKRIEIKAKADEALFEKETEERTLAKKQRELSLQNSRLERDKELLKELQGKFRELQERKFDENSLFCKLCGQPLPLTDRESLKGEYERNRAKELNEITTRGNALNDEIKEIKLNIEKLTDEISETEQRVKELEDEYKNVLAEKENITDNVNVEEFEEYIELSKQIEDKKKQLLELSDTENAKKQLKIEESMLRDSLANIEREIAKSELNDILDDRIAELQAEQKIVAQKVADQEKMIYLLEEFIRFKMDAISSNINEKFDGVCFKLFENQLNGGLKECCECTVNGVPYSSLNNGHRIVAGLKIIKALQELYGVSAPIFVDNAESVNDFNFPKMDSQLILLAVSNDKKLKIVSE